MKESISSVWTTGLVITFMLIFSGYLAVTISYSSTVKIKNGVLSIIEKRYGFTSKKPINKKSVFDSSKEVSAAWGTFESINLFLRGNSYKTQGACNSGKGDFDGIIWYGVKDLYKGKVTADTVPGTAEKAKKGSKYYYCFTKVLTSVNESNGNVTAGANKNASYYRIRLFYTLEVPIVNGLIFTIDGKTSTIERPAIKEIFAGLR